MSSLSMTVHEIQPGEDVQTAVSVSNRTKFTLRIIAIDKFY